MRRFILLMSALVALLPLTAVGVSQATTHPTKSCTAGGDTIYANIDYYPDGTSYRVDWWNWKITGNTAGHNNVNIKYRGYGGSQEYWSYNSPDTIYGGQWYYHYRQAYAPKASNPYARFQGIFDQSGGDPSCYVYNSDLVG